MRTRVALLFLAAPPALAGMASQRPLRRSAVAFNECSKGSDIDLPRFLHAAKQYCELAAQFGRFAVPSASEVMRCIVKIEQAAQRLERSCKKRYKTMRALLKAEVELGLHRPGGELADPSAAMGVLWTRRGLAFWNEVFRMQVHKSANLRDQMSAAYDRTLSRFHGFISRRAFSVASSATPSWEQVRANAALAPSEEALRDDLKVWTNALKKLLRSMTAMQVQLDLEDKRRSV
eukprot:CAMPEP_0119088670 /NCGR_PEP_ID=MMETSP1178-20130426/146333_1 /TAXON_ID=33656 /ORGANISM="unid sp, Strain CCMP2000" /LENGTH=232 /DNA_ID=CAMNT_0007071971 /DNA_START=21 /DNA_END=716 /DNA_ORIENTATION=-